MKIKKLTINHIPALFDFESRNRTWFEQFVPPRAEGYSIYKTFSDAICKLLEEQTSGTSIFFVLLDNDTVIGRANITEISEGKADIGYRVCQSSIGQGIVSKSVSHLVRFAENDLKVSKLHAITTPHNPASMRVLEKNNFTQTHTTDNAGVLNGVSLSFVHYICTLNPYFQS